MSITIEEAGAAARPVFLGAADVPAAEGIAGKLNNITKQGIPIKLQMPEMTPEAKQALAATAVLGLGGVGAYGLYKLMQRKKPVPARQPVQPQEEVA